jgi:hypothetical protein
MCHPYEIGFGVSSTAKLLEWLPHDVDQIFKPNGNRADR